MAKTKIPYSKLLNKRITPADLREVLSYNKATGRLTWKKNTGFKRLKGKPAGGVSKTSGYVMIGVFGVRLYAHRVAWVIVKGRWPTQQVDHKNLRRSDNRWRN